MMPVAVKGAAIFKAFILIWTITVKVQSLQPFFSVMRCLRQTLNMAPFFFWRNAKLMCSFFLIFNGSPFYHAVYKAALIRLHIACLISTPPFLWNGSKKGLVSQILTHKPFNSIDHDPFENDQSIELVHFKGHER